MAIPTPATASAVRWRSSCSPASGPAMRAVAGRDSETPVGPSSDPTIVPKPLMLVTVVSGAS